MGFLRYLLGPSCGVGGVGCWRGEAPGRVNLIKSLQLIGVRYPAIYILTPIPCPFSVAIPFSVRLLWSASMQAFESGFCCQVFSTLTVCVHLGTSSDVGMNLQFACTLARLPK